MSNRVWRSKIESRVCSRRGAGGASHSVCKTVRVTTEEEDDIALRGRADATLLFAGVVAPEWMGTRREYDEVLGLKTVLEVGVPDLGREGNVDGGLGEREDATG
jgi:hypothetical protein